MRSRQVLVAALCAIVLLAAPQLALAQGIKEVPRVTCTPSTSGGVPTSVEVQRAPAGPTLNWATIHTVTGAAAAAPVSFDDVNRPGNTALQHRCLWKNAGGDTPSQASVAMTFVDIAAPGEGKVQVIIITVPLQPQQ